MSLTCGEYEVHFGVRGGGKLLAVAEAKEIQWQRVLNGLSTSTIKIQQSGSGAVNTTCSDILSTLNPWQHEVELIRDGETVFVGPISADLIYDLSTGEVSVSARDLSAWLDVRRIKDDYDQDASTSLAQAFSFIFNNAYAQDPWNMNLVLQDSSVTGAYSVQASQNKYASSELQILTKSSLDYYVLRRAMYAFDIEVQTPVIANLTDNYWKTYPKITASGKVFASSLLVTGAGAGAQGSSATSEISQAAVVKQFGLVDRTFTEPTITDPDILDAAAQARYNLVSSPYLTITGGTLNYLAPILMSSLVPGVRVGVSLEKSQRQVIGFYRLVQLDVQRTADDETITPTLTPLGTTGYDVTGTLLPQNQDAIGGGSFNGV